MGVYINPPVISKESWIHANGTEVLTPTIPEDQNLCLTCLIDNGPFRALAVIYNQRELEAFTQPDDHRRRNWFTVEKVKLIHVCEKKQLEHLFPALFPCPA